MSWRYFVHCQLWNAQFGAAFLSYFIDSEEELLEIHLNCNNRMFRSNNRQRFLIPGHTLYTVAVLAHLVERLAIAIAIANLCHIILSSFLYFSGHKKYYLKCLPVHCVNSVLRRVRSKEYTIRDFRCTLTP
jgi:hypothetical protein